MIFSFWAPSAKSVELVTAARDQERGPFVVDH